MRNRTCGIVCFSHLNSKGKRRVNPGFYQKNKYIRQGVHLQRQGRVQKKLRLVLQERVQERQGNLQVQRKDSYVQLQVHFKVLRSRPHYTQVQDRSKNIQNS